MLRVSPARPSRPSRPARPVAWTFVSLLLILAWDASGLDLPLARLVGTPMGFPLRDNWFLVHVVHEGARALSWLLLIALALAIRWPFGFLRRLAVRARIQLTLGVLAGALVVSLVKQASMTSCPWDLQAFGGVAHHVSHWAWGVRDGGPGGCFPAGHASAGFGFVSGWFLLRHGFPRLARAWLAGALAAGLVLGLGQQLRGAHYMSHTLWTAWLCWAAGLLLDMCMRGSKFLRDRRARRGAASALQTNLNGS